MDDQDTNSTPEDIWKDDLLERRSEAELLIGYIKSVVDRPILREDSKAYTIAVDAKYGAGKTFFLRRLAQHLAIDHPVAFVDAWADDLANEPLAALMATLKNALASLIEEPSMIRDNWKLFAQKSGKVAAIATKGLLKKGAGLIITAGAVETLNDIMFSENNEVQEVIESELKKTGKDVIESTAGAFNHIEPTRLMEAQIEAFEDGQVAIREMKKSLETLVNSLDGKDHHAPIVIFIDELDRCRPTYAVKLLEEIKHLFDVPGLVFIFGMNGDQLGHSLCSAYGPNFDGAAYLRRFINRRYLLATPKLDLLVKTLLKKTELDTDRFQFPPTQINGNHAHKPDAENVIAKYMSAYGLVARDAFEVVDMLQTCTNLTNTAKLLMGYLLPLILSRILGAEAGSLLELKIKADDWVLVLGPGTQNRDDNYDIGRFASEIAEMVKNGFQKYSIDSDDPDYYPIAALLDAAKSSENLRGSQLADPANYGKLLETVGRFSNPQLEP